MAAAVAAPNEQRMARGADQKAAAHGPIPLVQAAEPVVGAATAACLSLPRALPNELELLHVLSGETARVACPCCGGTGDNREVP